MKVASPTFNGAVVPEATDFGTDTFPSETDTGIFPSETDTGAAMPSMSHSHSTVGSQTTPPAGQSSPASTASSGPTTSAGAGAGAGSGNGGITAASSSVMAFAGIAGVAAVMMAL